MSFNKGDYVELTPAASKLWKPSNRPKWVAVVVGKSRTGHGVYLQKLGRKGRKFYYCKWLQTALKPVGKVVRNGENEND